MMDGAPDRVLFRLLPIAGVAVLFAATSPTARALLRPWYRFTSLRVTAIHGADKVRDLWPTAEPAERQRLAWAFYRLHAMSDADRPPSLRGFRHEWRLLLEASVAVGPRWQWFVDRHYADRSGLVGDIGSRLRRFAWPILLMTRSSAARRPRLPLRNRLWSSTQLTVDGELVDGYPRYRPDASYRSVGDRESHAGWYTLPFWDDQWRLVVAELDAVGVWSAGERRRRDVAGGLWDRAPLGEAELEARMALLERRLDTLGQATLRVARSLIDMSRPPDREPADRDTTGGSADDRAPTSRDHNGGSAVTHHHDHDSDYDRRDVDYFD